MEALSLSSKPTGTRKRFAVGVRISPNRLAVKFTTSSVSPRLYPPPHLTRKTRWAFSYTRLNVHLAAAAAASGGCIIVDSTRAGKKFPDSLTATVRVFGFIEL